MSFRILSLLLLLNACLLQSTPVSAAPTLVWSDEFDGAAATPIDTSATGWNGGSGNAFLSGNGSVVVKKDWTEWTRDTYPVNVEHTYEIAFRFPSYTGSADFTPMINAVNQPVLVRPEAADNGLRFEIYQATANHHRLQWFQTGTSSRECRIPISAYYAGNWATNWQVAKFVVGPHVQAFYINDNLIQITRSDLSARGEELNVGLKGGNDTYPIEFDYVRVYEGNSAAEIPDNLILYDGFNQAGPKTPSNGFKNIEEFWTDESVQLPNGLGQAVLNSGNTTGWRTESLSWPFGLNRTFSQLTTLEVYLRCPQGVDLQEDTYVGIRQGSGTGNRIELYFRGGAWRPYINTGSSELVGTSDIRNFFVGNPTTDFQRIDIVFSDTAQAFYVNGNLAESFTGTLEGSATMQPWIKGNGPAKTVEVDSLALFDGDAAPITPVTSVRRNWMMYN